MPSITTRIEPARFGVMINVPSSISDDPVKSDSQRQTLRQRLEDGYGRIDQALADGADVAAWETFWIELLHEYELMCDEYRDAA